MPATVYCPVCALRDTVTFMTAVGDALPLVPRAGLVVGKLVRIGGGECSKKASHGPLRARGIKKDILR